MDFVAFRKLVLKEFSENRFQLGQDEINFYRRSVLNDETSIYSVLENYHNTLLEKNKKERR